MVTHDILNLAKDIHLPSTPKPKIPWGLVAASAVLGLLALSLYKTTVGKLLIFGGLGAALAMLAINTTH